MTERRIKFQALSSARFSPRRVNERELVTRPEDVEFYILSGLQVMAMQERKEIGGLRKELGLNLGNVPRVLEQSRVI